MTDRQEKFCIEFVRCGNATEAYKAAGYKVKSDRAATSAGNRLLTFVDVQKKVEELTRRATEGKIMDATERREVLTSIARSRGQDSQDRIRAIDTMNKMDGLYINKTQLSGEDGGPVRFRWENSNA